MTNKEHNDTLGALSAAREALNTVPGVSCLNCQKLTMDLEELIRRATVSAVQSLPPSARQTFLAKAESAFKANTRWIAVNNGLSGMLEDRGLGWQSLEEFQVYKSVMAALAETDWRLK